ncbi:MAG: hypothetical protein H6739_34065 [Alphaproteobacteria bacterium]|nr:hypothetical protein [Alphaproteobacteria bacterium]
MPTFVLRRDAPLTAEEAGRLPAAATTPDEPGVVARALVEAPIAELCAFAAQLARAVPDATFEVHVPAAQATVAPGEAPTVASGEAALVPADQVDAAFMEQDPWALLDRGDVATALRRFEAGYELDSEGRDRVFSLSRSGDPAEVALSVDVARLTGYKSFIMNIRRMAGHNDPRIREACAKAMGALGGNALLIPLERLGEDKVPAVRDAAKAAIAEIEARHARR